MVGGTPSILTTTIFRIMEECVCVNPCAETAEVFVSGHRRGSNIPSLLAILGYTKMD
jgi:hypothetical protein